ncbi:MAG: hypothetical protein PVI00_17395 [Desulfobacterales bacterium]
MPLRINFPRKQRAGGTLVADGYDEAWQRRVLQSFVKQKYINSFV